MQTTSTLTYKVGRASDFPIVSFLAKTLCGVDLPTFSYEGYNLATKSYLVASDFISVSTTTGSISVTASARVSN